MLSQHLTLFMFLLIGLENIYCKYLPENKNELYLKHDKHLGDISKITTAKYDKTNHLENNSDSNHSVNPHIFPSLNQISNVPLKNEKPSKNSDLKNYNDDVTGREDTADYSVDSSFRDVKDFILNDRRYTHRPAPAVYPHMTLPAPPVLTGSETYNTEGSEIGEATYIIPDELKGVISEPPPEPAQRTFGLTVNDGNVVRKEVRNDLGEFSNTYITADGTRQTQIGELVVQPNGAKVLVQRGSYSYRAPNGKRYQVYYKADSNGFQTSQVPLD